MSSSDDQDLSAFSMLDLFKSEAQQHTGTLIGGLLSPSVRGTAAELEPLMRASHSIKGAARIIGLDLIVTLGHAMEDVFNAAMKGKIKISPEAVEWLIEGVEWITRISDVAEADLCGFLEQNGPPVNELARVIRLIAENRPLPPRGAAGGAASEPQAKVPAAVEAGSSLSASLLLPSEPESTPDHASLEASSVASSLVSPSGPEASPFESGQASASPAPAAPVDLGDFSMIELFRAEADQHTGTLNAGLLALEKSPGDKSQIEPLMRAAHSIKGAARIVGIDLIVGLAHVMEDCFVSAQAGDIKLNSDAIDLMLRGVDWLTQVAGVSEAEFPSWLGKSRGEVDSLVREIEGVARGELAKPSRKRIESATEEHAAIPVSAAATPGAARAAPAPAAAQAPAPAVVSETASPRGASEPTMSESRAKSNAGEDTRVVRVTAENLNRVMALAGESLVESRRFQPLIDEMQKLKRSQNRLASAIQWLQDSLPDQVIRGSAAGPLSEVKQRAREVREVVAQQISQLESFARKADDISTRLYREAISSRMRPFGDACVGFPRLVRDVARQLNKKVKLEIIGEKTEVDRDILEKLEAPLSHMLRNSLDHGIEMPDRRIEAGKPETGTIRIEARHWAGMLSITISDDGRGVNLEVLRVKIVEKQLTTSQMARNLSDGELMDFLFLPGFSTASRVTELSGRGVGLDVVQSMAQQVGGVVRATTVMGKGMTFHLNLPITMSVIRAVAVEIGGEIYAFPLTRIDRVEIVPVSQTTTVENRQQFTREGKHIGLVQAADVLGLESQSPLRQELTVVVVSDRNESFGLVVDRYFGEQDLVVRRLDPRLGKVPDISAAALLEDGTPLLIIDVEDMVRSIDKLLHGGRLGAVRTHQHDAKAKHRKRVLVVEDSITVREVERKLLENRGYDVEVAVDGADGWNAVRSGKDVFDLVISDVDMPRMNGIELVRSIKQDATLRQIPVLIVSYKDREEDRMRGLEAGATAYLTKGSFHDQTLLNMVVDLIGEPDA